MVTSRVVSTKESGLRVRDGEAIFSSFAGGGGVVSLGVGLVWAFAKKRVRQLKPKISHCFFMYIQIVVEQLFFQTNPACSFGYKQASWNLSEKNYTEKLLAVLVALKTVTYCDRNGEIKIQKWNITEVDRVRIVQCLDIVDKSATEAQIEIKMQALIARKGFKPK